MEQICTNCTNTKADVSSNGIKKESKVEYLHIPIKSESDKKEYRVLQLENGLAALLISEMKKTNMRTQKETNKTDSCGKIDKSNEFRNIENIEIEEKMAACAISINIGSFSDPIEIQGMAHFLEHVISLGSVKYPEENEYDRFVKSKGGLLHADTGHERTKYIFQIHPNYLLPAMDRFAHFFINPLLKKDVILRERESVDNEFHMDSASDYERLKQFFRIIASDNHPAAKFSCGNLVTLRDNIGEDTLYSELQAFRKRYYSANRMTLVVQANLSLDTLEQYVEKCFSDVPVHDSPFNDYAVYEGVASFDVRKFKKLYKIKSFNDTCEMELKWIMPPSEHLYRSKPIDYISRIINSEGKGSLSHYLREQKLCNRISSSYEQCSLYSVLKLNLVLPHDGSRLAEKILETVFSYVNMLRRKGPQRRIFDEFKDITFSKFRFAEQIDAATNVQGLCSDMYTYPPTDYIIGSRLYFEYDPECIQSFLDCLTPENLFIVLLDKKFDEEEFDQIDIEPWYRIMYSSTEIPDEWIAKWREIEPFMEFRIPEPNSFVSTDFSLIDPPNCVPNYPIKIGHNKKMEIWYKPDLKYRLPNCYVYLHLLTPLCIESIDSCVMLRLFNILLHELVLEDLYDAKCAGLAYHVVESGNGVLVKVNGFSQKVPLLLNILMKYIADFSSLLTKELFSLVKSELLKYYSSVLCDPGALASEISDTILESNFYTSTKNQAALVDIEFNQFFDFLKRLTHKVHIRCLVQGNITKTEALKMIHESTARLKCGSLPPREPLNIDYHLLPLGQKCCWVKNVNLLDVNSVVMNYYQTDTEFSKLSLPIFKEFLEMIMQAPLFHQLRTKEQLGYSVSCSGVPGGFNIAIYSPAHKFTTEYVNERIEYFMKHFISTLKQTSEDAFNDWKECFNKFKNCGDISLRDEVDRNWFAISTKRFIFDQHCEQISAINNLKIDELREWIGDHFIGGKYFRKLSVQVVGNKQVVVKDKTVEGVEGT